MSTGVRTIPREAVRFEFLGHGNLVQPRAKADRIAIDVGNHLGPGVLDHHHLAAYAGSTTSLVLHHPDLIDAAIRPRRRVRDPFTISVHADPDLDCAAAAYLVLCRLTTETFPAGSETLASYLDQVDQGRIGTSPERPFSLYSAYQLLGHRLGLRTWTAPEDCWREWLLSGLRLVEFSLARAVQDEVSLTDVDAFACPGLFGPPDRAEVTSDLERYQNKLSDPAVRARSLELRLPRHFGGMAEVPALFVRDVQQPDDPKRCLFFKDWARTDANLAPSGPGFVALSIYMSGFGARPARCIISVGPDRGVSLRGLGERLEQAEAAERIRRFGGDDRVEDPVTHARKPPRPGYANADPWYDGRAHGYTIVDAPRSGTLLAPDRIEEILREFGSATDPGPPVLPDERSASPEGSQQTLGQLSFLVQAWQREQDLGSVGHADVFISYPRTREQWVRTHVYQPLKDCRPGLRVFFDVEALRSGIQWFARLASAVAECRLFIPIYCPEYFASDFCQWELQLALVRDPIGRAGLVVPILLEPIELPPYCALIQADSAAREDVGRRVVELARGIP